MESVAAIALLGGVVVAIRIAAENSVPPQSRAALNAPAATVAIGANTRPPWPAPSNAGAAVAKARLPMLRAEGTAEHIHAHLDVLIEGTPVPVPAGIGIDSVRRTMSPLHTHDDNGVIHVESPVQRQFSLGEFFTEWGVGLSANHIGALRTADGKSLRVYVNGIPRLGNPAGIIVGNHDEIALIYGSARNGEPAARTYDFGSV